MNIRNMILNMPMNVAASLCVLSLFTSSAYGGGYVGEGKITMMQNAYGGWIMATSGAANNPDSCELNTIILEGSHSQYKELYSLLLSAYVTGKPVVISVSGCHANGYKRFSFVYTSGW